MASKILSLVRLLRPKQWVKNGFVLAGVVFGTPSHALASLVSAALALAGFCLMGSAVYVVNDYLDRDADRRHPVKRQRPLASGAVRPWEAFAVAGGCVAGASICAWAADPRVLAIVVAYATINGIYSLRLKRVVIADVFCIAAGFMLRILAGSWGIHITPSGWLILTGMFVTLFLGFAKRRAEWLDANGRHDRRPVLAQYSPTLLDSFLSITATGAILSYGLYTLDAGTIQIHHTDKLIYTVPFVLYAMFRYLFLLYGDRKGEDPSVDVFTDPQILAAGAAYAGVTVWLLNR